MTRWTQADVDRMRTGVTAPRRTKYNVRTVKHEGLTFGSPAEKRRWQDLQLMEKAGEIGELELHPRFSLDVNGHHIGNYTGDFGYFTPKGYVVEDVKSKATKKARDYPLRKKLMRAIHGIEITEIA